MVKGAEGGGNSRDRGEVAHCTTAVHDLGRDDSRIQGSVVYEVKHAQTL